MALEAIVARTRAEVERRKAETCPDRLDGLSRSDRGLKEALRRRRTGFILECKRSSPSRGAIRPDADAADVARAYAPHADAISVLTNAPFFGGSPADLARVRRAAPQPVLCKDFMVDPWQVREARAYGADAILLILSIVDDVLYRTCAAEAQALGMDVLTEVHSQPEVDRAVRLGAEIIGINNRNLDTLAVDLGTVRRLAPMIPPTVTVVCESGISSHDDVRALRGLVDAFLVGTSLMAEVDLPGAVRRLIYGVNKVCGLTTPEDARAAEAAGATHGGLIFAAESPRRVDLAQAAAIRAAGDLRWVGVFVNAALDEVARTATDLSLSAVQLHGEEDARWIADLRPVLPGGCAVWKAVRVRDRIPAAAETGADLLVLDGWVDGRRGGTGRTFDWSLLRDYPDVGRVLVGGGLTAERAPAAAALGAHGLDVNSGVESAPGRKDAARLDAFFGARRGAGRSLSREDV